MTLWSRIVLIAFVLAGLLAAPAIGSGMRCNVQMMPAHTALMAAQAAMAIHDHAKPVPESHQKPSADASDLACISHCLTTSAFIPALAPMVIRLNAAATTSLFRIALPEGLAHGPPLEPPIALFV